MTTVVYVCIFAREKRKETERKTGSHKTYAEAIDI